MKGWRMYISLSSHQDTRGHWSDETTGPQVTVVVSQLSYAAISAGLGKPGLSGVRIAVML